MNTYDFELIEEKLLALLNEMETQDNLLSYYPDDRLSFAEEMAQIKEFIDVAGEYGLAYESIVANLEQVPFILSGKAAVNLLELGLLMKFKTDREEDAIFDFR